MGNQLNAVNGVDLKQAAVAASVATATNLGLRRFCAATATTLGLLEVWLLEVQSTSLVACGSSHVFSGHSNLNCTAVVIYTAHEHHQLMIIKVFNILQQGML